MPHAEDTPTVALVVYGDLWNESCKCHPRDAANYSWQEHLRCLWQQAGAPLWLRALLSPKNVPLRSPFMGRPSIGNHPMSPAERQRRRRALLARDLARERTAMLPVNQVITGHAAKVMAGWPSNSVDLIITSPPYFDAVEYEGSKPWRS
jgi:hypothetical protein